MLQRHLFLDVFFVYKLRNVDSNCLCISWRNIDFEGPQLFASESHKGMLEKGRFPNLSGDMALDMVELAGALEESRL